MISNIKSLCKVLYVFILVITCSHQLCAIKLVLAKIFLHNIDFRSGNEIYDNFLLKKGELICFGGEKNFSKLLNISFEKNCTTPKKYVGDLVKQAAVSPYNKIIGAIVEKVPECPQLIDPEPTSNIEKCKTMVPDSPREISLFICSKRFIPLKKINLDGFIPTKIYYTPNGKFLVALTFPPDDMWHETPCIQMIDPNSDLDTPVAMHKITLPENIEPSLDLDDYLFVTNDNVVYESSHYLPNKINPNNRVRAGLLYRIIPETPFIENPKSPNKNETIYEIIEETLSIKSHFGSNPIYINPAKGRFFLHSAYLNKLKLFEDGKVLASIELKNSNNYDMTPLVIFPDKYIAICQNDKIVKLYDLNLNKLDKKKINTKEDGLVEKLRFSDDGNKLIVTTNKKVLLFNIEK